MTYAKALLFAFLAFVAATCAVAQEAEQEPPVAQDSNPPSVEAQPPKRVRVGGNVAGANLIHQVTPIYPDIAKQAHIMGTVVLHAVIAADGTIRDLQYISGPPLLMNSAMDAVRQWVYKKTLLNGQSVEVDTTITVVYTLGNPNKSPASGEINPSEVAHVQTSQTPAPTAADAPVAAASGQAVSVPSYPNTASGLEQMMKDMMKLEKEGNTDDLGVYAKSLTLPDADHWFKSVFGDDAGTALATASLETRKFINLIAPATLADLRKENLTEVKAAVFDDPCNPLVTPQEYSFLRLRRHQERLYDVRFSDGKKSSVWLYFAYVDKGFRYVGKLTWDQAKGYSHPPTILHTEAATGNGNSDLSKAHAPVHVGASVAAAQLIHQEAPYYPLEAKENHIQGNVVLHAIIAKDGSVHDLELKEGPCALAGSALDAVQNWRYKPMLLNGEPTEVDTTITVVFTLGR